MEDEGKKRLRELAQQVRQKMVKPEDTEGRALRFLEELASELGGPDGFPGLRVRRETPGRLRIQREKRNAQLTLEWQKDIQAIELTAEYLGEQKLDQRYVFDPNEDRWRRFEGVRSFHDELTDVIAALLYPDIAGAR